MKCQAQHHKYRNRTTCMHRNRKPCNSFLMVNIASGMDPGRLRPTTTTTTTSTTSTTHNIAAVLQLYQVMQPWGGYIFHIRHRYYGLLTRVKRGLPYHGSMFRAHLRQRCLKVYRLPSTDFWTPSRAHVRLTCCITNQAQVVRKHLQFVQTRRHYQNRMPRLFCFVHFEIIESQTI